MRLLADFSSRDKRNAALNIAGETVWGLQAAMVGSATVLTVLLRELGATETFLGAIPAVQSGAIVLPQMLGAYLFTSHRKRKGRLILWHIAAVVPFLLVMGLVALASPRIAEPAARWALLGCFCLFMLGIGVIVAVWSDWIAHLFDTGIRGRVMGGTFCGAALGGVAGSLLAGMLIGLLPAPGVYALLYMAAGAIAVVGVSLYWFVDDPATKWENAEPRLTWSAIAGHFRHSLGDSRYRAMLLGRSLSAAGFCMMPFVVVYFTSEAGGRLSNGLVISASAAMSVGTAVTAILFGRMGDRRGHRLGAMLASGLQVATLTALLVGGGAVGCVVVYALAGASFGGGFISHSNMMLESCPHECRVVHLSAGNLIVGAVSMLAPLAAGLTAATWGVRTLFVGCLALSAAALAWFALFVEDPRRFQKPPAATDARGDA